MIRFKLLGILFSVFIIWSCGKPESNKNELTDLPEHVQNVENLAVFDFDTEPTDTIKISQEVIFTEIFMQLLSPTRGYGPSYAVDNKGKVFITDGEKTSIDVYDGTGNKLGIVGGKGRGPGEFLRIDALYNLNQKLFVYDSNLIRLSVFDTESFELIKVLNFDTQVFSNMDEVKVSVPGTVIPFTNSTYLISLMLNNERKSYGYFQINDDGELISENKLIKNDRKEMHNGRLKNGALAGITLPYSVSGLIAVSDSAIYHASSDEILIKIYNSSAEYERAIYYPFKKDPLEQQEVLDTFHPNLQPAIKSAEFSETWPALEKLLVDDKGRIWIAKIVDDKSVHSWSVLEQGGTLKANFEWPVDQSIELIRNNKIYVEEINLETRTQVLTSYSFEFVD